LGLVGSRCQAAYLKTAPAVKAANTPIIEITTSNSIKVKALLLLKCKTERKVKKPSIA
jgi:hypothetical protein